MLQILEFHVTGLDYLQKIHHRNNLGFPIVNKSDKGFPQGYSDKKPLSHSTTPQIYNPDSKCRFQDRNLEIQEEVLGPDKIVYLEDYFQN